MKKFFSNFDLFGRKGVEARSGTSSTKGGSVKDNIREWNRSIRRETRKIDRDIDAMNRSEKTTIAELRKLAAKKEIGALKILSKQLVYARKSKERMMLTKTQLNSVSNQLTQQMSLAKLGNTFKMSADIMASLNELLNVPEIHEMMSQMGREMESMGVIDKIMSEGIDEALADPDTEEQTELEVNKLLDELAIDAVSLMPGTVSGRIRGQQVPAAASKVGAPVAATSK